MLTAGRESGGHARRRLGRTIAAMVLHLTGLLPWTITQALQVQGAPFYHDGRPVRLWGVHIAPGLSAPACEDSDLLVARLGELGFNAVAIWGSETTCLREVSPRTAGATVLQ